MVRARLHPSCLLAAVLVLVHVGAAATALPLDLPLEAKLTLLALLIASLIRSSWRHALLRGRQSIIELEVHDRAHAAVRTRTSTWLEAKILGTSCVTPLLTVINFRVKGSYLPHHVLLVRDNLPADDFRKIRVLLRWARPKPETIVDSA